MLIGAASTIPIAQFSFIFWWTFQVLSWDIMEPVCYLMTFSNFTGGFFFYCMMKKDLELTNFNEIMVHRFTEKACENKGIDLADLEAKKEEIEQLRE